MIRAGTIAEVYRDSGERGTLVLERGTLVLKQLDERGHSGV
jgi:hypothetical protein